MIPECFLVLCVDVAFEDKPVKTTIVEIQPSTDTKLNALINKARQLTLLEDDTLSSNPIIQGYVLHVKSFTRFIPTSKSFEIIKDGE